MAYFRKTNRPAKGTLLQANPRLSREPSANTNDSIHLYDHRKISDRWARWL